jgi:aspartate/methionine/tyrosine aminotransferase
MTYLNEGDGVLVPNPYYPTYKCRNYPEEYVDYDLKEAHQYEPDFEEIEKLLSEEIGKVKLMFVNYPQMPQQLPTENYLERLLHLQKT